jgi:hypothetical protein
MLDRSCPHLHAGCTACSLGVDRMRVRGGPHAHAILALCASGVASMRSRCVRVECGSHASLVVPACACSLLVVYARCRHHASLGPSWRACGRSSPRMRYPKGVRAAAILLISLLFVPCITTAQEVQPTGPLRAAPSLRPGFLWREGRLSLSASGGIALPARAPAQPLFGAEALY